MEYTLRIFASPARAGMDRGVDGVHAADLRFPRTGGDGPYYTTFIAQPAELPPHGRGWTAVVVTGLSEATASPARAGMDRRGRHGPVGSHGFPRTGGDGPPWSSRACRKPRLPPHGRGWTGLCRYRSSCPAASPARAGMDLRIGEVRVTRERAGASPARAGMDPPRRGRAGWRDGFPRTGGDGPAVADATTIDWQLPPHGRGWTRGRDPPARPLPASPARAGMDRQTYLVRMWFIRLPPHGRGWTSAPPSPRPPSRASPARAGMDRL